LPIEEKGKKRIMAYASEMRYCSFVFLSCIFCPCGFIVANNRAVAAMSTANGIAP
jgi:hypothetical protein